MSPLFVFFILFSVFPTLIHSKQIHGYYNSSHIVAGCRERERKILISFKLSVEDPTGMLSSWHGRDCCKWSGVDCSNRTGYITKLDLRGLCDESGPSHQSLKGKLNDLSFFELKYLHYLDLSCNSFENSAIPSSIGSMKRLGYLNLSSTLFSGMVPPHLGNLSSLLYLDLNNNKNIGWNWVSDLNWLSGLPLLKYLNLGYVNLSTASMTWLQALNTLSSIEEMHFPGCNLHVLPHKSPSVSNFTSLSVLNLMGNDFNSTFPNWLLNITTLTHLNLGLANIGNSLANIQWKHLCNLQSLDLSYNDMNGEIVRFIDSLSKCSNVSMEELNLLGNKLHGQLPESLGQLRNLRYLDLSANMLSGHLPASIGNLSHLTMLSMRNNKLNGTLPETIGQLDGLVELDLTGNDWIGAISESHFLHLKNLKHFTLSSKNKSVTFDFGENWVPCFSLKSIDIYDCQMNPKFPLWLETQTQLHYLRLEKVAIIGVIPFWFWKLISLQLTSLILSNNQLSGKLPKVLNFAPDAKLVDLSYNFFEGSLPIFLHIENLYLRNNSFSGPIPPAIGSQMPRISELDLSENFLTGNIPASVGNLTHLLMLSISSNNLSGKIPQLKGLQNLYGLELSKNHLVGTISQSLCLLPQLQELMLNENNLSGNLGALRNCTFLSLLNLAENHFIGNIPRLIGKMMPYLSILNLRGNSFTGTIPKDLCQLPYLHILDLSHNNLTGGIPSCIGNLVSLSGISDDLFARYLNEEIDLSSKGRSLTYTSTVLNLVNIIDLSRNNLKGKIPVGLINLTRLGALNLSRNQLTGTLPEQIGRLTLLETLDLSSNHLCGLIPTSITDMTSLSHLNLSYNNLSGQIPSANQFSTLNVDPSIYEGNLHLCGSPLLKRCSTTYTHKEDVHGSDENEKDEKVLDMLWFNIGLAFGVIVGIWAVCGSLAINKYWRHRFYQFLDKASDRIYVEISLRLAGWRRKLKAQSKQVMLDFSELVLYVS